MKRSKMERSRKIGLDVLIFNCRTAIFNDSALERQKQSLEAHIKKNYTHVNIAYYADNGCSGMDFNRPALNRLNRDINAGKIDMIIVQNLSRIGRDRTRTLKWMDALSKIGISFIAIDSLSLSISKLCANPLRQAH